MVEDVLTSGLPAKLMRFLRFRVLGETSSSQKDSGHLIDSRHASTNTSTRGREDGRGRFRQVPESNHLDDTRMIDERSLDDRHLERDQDRSIIGQTCQEESWVDGEPPDGLGEGADTDGDDRWHGRDTRDGRTKFGDHDDSTRDDSSRRRANRGWARSRGKGRFSEGTVENEPVLTSPGSASQLGQGRNVRDRSIPRNSDLRRVPDSKKTPGRIAAEPSVLEREDNDDCFQGCRIGSKDIFDVVRKAVRAAEAEARAANAPEEAVKAAGDAAAELVKTAASEVCWRLFNLCFIYDCVLCAQLLNGEIVFC